MRNLPREINVGLIEIGDTIEVTHKKSKGITLKYIGKVSELIYNGAVRRLLTEEGATILTWQPGKPNPKVVLISREPTSATLFEFADFNEIKERVNG